MSAQIALVTVAYRSAAVIGGLLDSIPGSSTSPIQLVVVDNSPDDDGLAALLASRPDTTFLHAPDNPGYGTAVNRGAAALGPDVRWLVVSNPDLVIGAGAVDILIAAAGRLDAVGSLGPLIRNGDGSAYPSARKLPSLRTGVGHAMLRPLWPGNPFTRRYRNDALVEEREAGWLSGSFLVIPREVFDEVGGFDEGYFMYFEDVDLGRRIGLTSRHNYYVPSAEVTHFGAMSTQQSPRPMIRAHHRSAYRYLAAKYHAWYLWPLRVALRVGLWLRAQVARV